MRLIFLLAIYAAAANAENWRHTCKDSCLHLDKYLGQQGELQGKDVKGLARQFCKEYNVADNVCEVLIPSAKIIVDYTKAGVSIYRLCRWRIVCPALKKQSKSEISKEGDKRTKTSPKLSAKAAERDKSKATSGHEELKTTSAPKKADQNGKKSSTGKGFMWKRIKSNFHSLLEIISPFKEIAKNLLSKAEEAVKRKVLLPKKTTHYDGKTINCLTCKRIQAYFKRTFTEAEKKEARKIFATFCNEFMPPFMRNSYCDDQSIDKLVHIIQLTMKSSNNICGDCKQNSSTQQLKKRSLRKELCNVCNSLEELKDRLYYYNFDQLEQKLGEQCKAAYTKCASISRISWMVKNSLPMMLQSFTKKKCETMIQCSSLSKPKGIFPDNFYCKLCRKVEASFNKANITTNASKLQQIADKCKGLNANRERLQCLRHMKGLANAVAKGAEIEACDKILCNSSSTFLKNLVALQKERPTDNLCDICQAGLQLFSEKAFYDSLRGTVNNVCEKAGLKNVQCLSEKFRVDRFFQNIYKNQTREEACRRMSFCVDGDKAFINQAFRRVKGILSSLIAAN